MLYITPPNYRFCPFCANPLEVRLEEGKERKYCLEDKWTYYPHVATTAMAIIKKGDQVVMVKRAKEPYRGKWMFPAGFLEFGELPLDGIKREIKEETGLDAEDGKLVDIVQVCDDPREPTQLNFVYLVAIKDFQNLKTDKNENEDIAWFNINSQIDMSFDCHKDVLKKLKEGKYPLID